MTEPLFDVTVMLIDSNTGAIMAAVADGMKRAGAGSDEIASMRVQMLSGDYNNVLQTAMRYVRVTLPGDAMEDDDDTYDYDRERHDDGLGYIDGIDNL